MLDVQPTEQLTQIQPAISVWRRFAPVVWPLSGTIAEVAVVSGLLSLFGLEGFHLSRNIRSW